MAAEAAAPPANTYNIVALKRSYIEEYVGTLSAIHVKIGYRLALAYEHHVELQRAGDAEAGRVCTAIQACVAALARSLGPDRILARPAAERALKRLEGPPQHGHWMVVAALLSDLAYEARDMQMHGDGAYQGSMLLQLACLCLLTTLSSDAADSGLVDAAAYHAAAASYKAQLCSEIAALDGATLDAILDALGGEPDRFNLPQPTPAMLALEDMATRVKELRKELSQDQLHVAAGAVADLLLSDPQASLDLSLRAYTERFLRSCSAACSRVAHYDCGLAAVSPRVLEVALRGKHAAVQLSALYEEMVAAGCLPQEHPGRFTDSRVQGLTVLFQNVTLPALLRVCKPMRYVPDEVRELYVCSPLGELDAAAAEAAAAPLVRQLQEPQQLGSDGFVPLDTVFAAVLELGRQEEQLGEAEQAMDARMQQMTEAAKAMVCSPTFLFSPALSAEDWHLIAALSHGRVRQPQQAAAADSSAGRQVQLQSFSFVEPETLWRPEKLWQQQFERPRSDLGNPLHEIKIRQGELAQRQAKLQLAEAAAGPAFQAVERGTSLRAADTGMADDEAAPAAGEQAGAGAAAAVLGGDPAAAAVPAAAAGPEAEGAGAAAHVEAEAPAEDAHPVQAMSPQDLVLRLGPQGFAEAGPEAIAAVTITGADADPGYPVLLSHSLGAGEHTLTAAHGRAFTAAVKKGVLPAAATKAAAAGAYALGLAFSPLGGGAAATRPAFVFEVASISSSQHNFGSTQMALHTCQKVSAIASGFSELRTRHPAILGCGLGKGLPPAMQAALCDPACGLHWALSRLPQAGQPLLRQLPNLRWVPFSPAGEA